MTHIETLKLARGVLERFSCTDTYQNEDDEVGRKVCCSEVSYRPHAPDCTTVAAITAIDQAIEQAEQAQPAATVVESDPLNPAGETLKAAYLIDKSLPKGTNLYTAPPLRQPDMADAYIGAREDLSIWKRRALEAEALNRKFIAELNGPTHMGEPSPPPRQPWVGLTVEEIVARALHLSGLGTHPDVIQFARAIEAKLKEKNT